ncbi:MAG: hypothetical protein BWY11_00632 [Firmicutes bacterium ADurb.Bin182]|nr:MAG: hypothetical protein BWY11_00632 [Firmicutes bacterium ADurb.Bin182]
MEEGRVCTNCGECSVCDLDPGKICDNCCKCIDGTENYRKVSLADLYSVTDRLLERRNRETDEHMALSNPHKRIKVIVRYNADIRGKRTILF